MMFQISTKMCLWLFKVSLYYLHIVITASAVDLNTEKSRLFILPLEYSYRHRQEGDMFENLEPSQPDP